MRLTSRFDLTTVGHEGEIQYVALFFSLVYLWIPVIYEIRGFPCFPDAVHEDSHCHLVSFYPCVLDWTSDDGQVICRSAALSHLLIMVDKG